MGRFYEKLASLAALEGQSADEFRKISRRNTKACFVFAIVAGIVWFMAGWQWALFPILFGLTSAMASISGAAFADELDKQDERGQ